ncbi:trimethylamine methyltransferase family protein [bacterium]|nr:trimethylamine methyltransferase family protein [bacterium]
MRPQLRFLDDALIERILGEARDILAKLGMEIHNDEVIALLADHGAKVLPESSRVCFPGALIDMALRSAPSSFELFDGMGEPSHDFSGDQVHFTPGSSAINLLDYDTGKFRRPHTADYVRQVKLVEGLGNIAAQSTAFVPADVPEGMADSYRLFLSLLYGNKPVVTGAFTIESVELMRKMQCAVRGSSEALAKQPLTVFSCCPTAPLKWSEITSQNLIDCARAGIPVEYISMPLTGFMAPITLVGSLVQHTAETLSGIVISQLAAPGSPALYGGSPAAFDIRYETTPMGAIETQMIDCAYSEIGKYLGLPTQAYIGLSDAKALDAQAGLETSMGATLAALSGVNSISGPGMLDFESCISLEKLVIDNEIAGLALRMIRGIEPKEDFPALPRFEEMLSEGHLLISEHTMKYMREEHYWPGPTIERANLSRWMEEGSKTLGERANSEVERLISEWTPTSLAPEIKSELVNLMESEAASHGMDKLPEREPWL